MITTDKTDETLPRTELADDARAAYTGALFGLHFPLRLEPAIYAITDRLAPAYTGGYWRFWRLGNEGFYMAPDAEETFEVNSMNGWQGELSADALGIVCCLTAYSHLSFGGPEVFARTCAKHYHLLRDGMMEHPEVEGVLCATD
jgi:hypothetical protein